MKESDHVTYKLTDQHRRVLCEMIGECWHTLTLYLDDGSVECACGERFRCPEDGTYHVEELNDRPFTTGNDIMLVKEAIERSGEWQQFCSYADIIFMGEKMKGVNGHYISIYEFEGWLLEPERFCCLAAEFETKKEGKDEI